MKRGDVICNKCNAGFRRIELSSRRGTVGEYRCPVCNQILETFDGSVEIAYRLTIAPVKAMVGTSRMDAKIETISDA
jgi:hypothetical protein